MLNDRKIQDWTQAVSSLADKPQMTAAELKAAFDGNTNQVRPALNGLIDDLQAAEAAGQLGFVATPEIAAGNVQAALGQVQANLETYEAAMQAAGGASAVGFAATPEIAAGNVQAALEKVQDNLVAFAALLESRAGALEIGVEDYADMEGGTLQGTLERLSDRIKDVTAGMIPDFGVTWAKLAQEVRDAIDAGVAAVAAHANKSVVGTDGVHGLRYNNDKLQVWTGSAWEDTKSGTQIPLADCTNVAVVAGNTQLTLKWTDPADLEVAGVKIAEWASTKLVRKVGSYPANEADGTLVVTSSVRNQYASTGYTDTGLTNGTTYYYKLFPVSKDGAVTMGSGNNISGTPVAYRTFGVAINLANSNPLTAVTYTDDAVGMTAGSTAWESQPIFKDIKPCLLKNGVVQYYLNPNDFTKKANGSAAVITGNDGDVMIEIPKTGYQINTVGNTLTVKVTDDPAKAGFKYYAHTRVAEGDRDKLYIGAYHGQTVSSKLRSISGVLPTATQNIGTFRTQAKANGAGYDLLSFYPLTLIQCLFVIRFKNLDSQTALGRGYVDGNSAAIATGGTNAKGMYFGEATGKQQMKCFGIEDLWGNVRDWIDGLFSDANRNILTAFQDFNDTGSGYTNRGQGAAANSSGYMRKPQGTSEAGFIVKEADGSATTYCSDDATLYTSCLPDFGGNWGSADYAGVFALNVGRSASVSSASLGARLMFL